MGVTNIGMGRFTLLLPSIAIHLPAGQLSIDVVGTSVQFVPLNILFVYVMHSP